MELIVQAVAAAGEISLYIMYILLLKTLRNLT